ncbi:unnamed protein product [Oikopleura dioica]|uniref:ER lumen protein-retaining receptor n=1 Tax=Oikopleura dioica TaxID=34765 RepID=E4X0C6_OIKDI|nr:unnamed protein product [Oikopleura dioica]
MNLFRLCGDLSHLFAMLILLAKIWKSRSVSGISGKSQMLFFLVFVTRYLDLFTVFISPYNTFMKCLYLLCSFVTCFFIYSKFRSTYNEEGDKFRIEFILVPAVGMAFLVHHDFNITELLWTFSIYLESVAIMPQLQMIAETGEAESITSHYLFFQGAYRALYIINWYWRFTHENFVDKIAVVAGCVQTVLYMDFFYLYITKVLYGKRLTIPGGGSQGV